MTCQISCVGARLEDIAKDDVIDFGGGKTSSLDRFPGRNNAQLSCAQVLERAAEFTERSPRARDDDNFSVASSGHRPKANTKGRGGQ